MPDESQEFNADELRFRGILAKVLWTVDNKGHEFASSEDRQMAFLEERGAYVMKASQVMRQLKLKDVTLRARDEF